MMVMIMVTMVVVLDSTSALAILGKPKLIAGSSNSLEGGGGSGVGQCSELDFDIYVQLVSASPAPPGQPRNFTARNGFKTFDPILLI